jgi:choline dehydrogenase-like flavoprotein
LRVRRGTRCSSFRWNSGVRLQSGGVLTDGHGIPADTVLLADLCIIGAGPAGQAIVRELTGSGVQILLIERGDLGDHATADLASVLEFESPNFWFLQHELHNQFGGMSGIWNTRLPDGVTPAARYLPLDPLDFEARSWVPDSGWPITSVEMDPYYDRARALCGVGPFDFRGRLPETGREPLSTPAGELVTRLDQLGAATVFTHLSLEEMRKSDQVQLLTNAIAVELASADGSEDGMASTSVRTLGGVAFTIRSRFVVVAGGSPENARLLLNSTSQYSSGLGNHFDNVGRYFMDHPRVLLSHGSYSQQGSMRSMELYEPHSVDGQVLGGKLKLSDEVLRREELLNGNAQFMPYHRSVSQLEAARSARVVLSAVRHRGEVTGVPKHLAKAVRHAPSIAWYLFNRHRNLSEVASEDFETGKGKAPRSFKLIYQPEQAPSRENRVTLSERRDAFGYRIAHLYSQWSEIDLRSIRRARQIFAAELQASGLADFVQAEDDVFPRGADEASPRSAAHLLGTTRMHDDPRHGVVDRDCKIHGTSSVYVAGASVFPTGGCANPTLTVVALAIRLADELKRTMRATQAS